MAKKKTTEKALNIRNKYRQLKQLVEKSEAKVIILDMICFEYFILAFDKLVSWTGTGKTDKIKMREDILAAIEDHRIDLSKIDNQMTMHYLSGFKRYSTERVMKSLVGEFTQNEKWSVKGPLMGECWYKDCCVSEHPDSLRCGNRWSFTRKMEKQNLPTLKRGFLLKIP